MMNNTFLLWVLLLVNGVFGVYADEVKSVSVMVGDSVTLHTDVTEELRGSNIIWKFGDKIIARMTDPGRPTYPSAIFKDRLKLDETGSLTITDITVEHIGRYIVDIKNITAKLKTFQVTVHDEIRGQSVIEGNSVILRTGVLGIQGYSRITWKFKDHLMAEIHQATNRFSLFSAGGRFENRLVPDHLTGSLNISKSKTTDSGDYHLCMESKTHSIQRTISVNVSASPHSGAPSGICGAGVGLVVWAVTVFFAARSISNQGKRFQ